MFYGHFLYVFRAACGDFSMYNAATYLDETSNWIFWFLFVVILVVTKIIFMNFVIAEALNSYTKIKQKLNEWDLKENAYLIDEAENMIPRFIRT